MKFVHSCVLLLLLMRQQLRKHFFKNSQSSYENFWDKIPHNHQLIWIGHVRNGTYIHIVTNLWKRICNFENIEIIGIPSPNASTIICDLAQDEQIKQQFFKFWSHLTVIFERNVYINVFAYFTYLFVYVRLFRIFFLCLSICLPVRLSVCLSVQSAL